MSPISTRSRPYWVLFVRIDGRWAPQFGDYDRAEVVAEEKEWRNHPAKDRRIDKIGPRQADIDAFLAKINRGPA